MHFEEKMKKLLILIKFLCLIQISAPLQGAEKEVNIYSGRKGKLIEPMLKKFESDTGI